jgi:hypothetical protein
MVRLHASRVCTLAASAMILLSGSHALAQRADPVKPWESFDFRSREVTANQLKGLSLLQLKYLRGILFGKHGRVFNEAAIQDWLKTRPWYRPRAKYAVTELNESERRAMDAIKEAEHRKHAHIEPGDLKFYRNRPVTKQELGKHSRIEWLIMRAEVEAIHGKSFTDSPWLQNFFEERYWYHPNPSYRPESLTDVERKNLQTLASAQKVARGVALAPGDMEQFQETPIGPELLKGLSLYELRLLRNEVYARHGMRFHTSWLQEHFDDEPWYRPQAGYTEPHLLKVEARNVALIVAEEARLHAELATKPIPAARLAGLYLEDARKLRNEIYARHGMTFKDRWLDGYFRSMEWYQPDPGYSESRLNDVERRNVKALLAYERGARKAADAVAA